MGWTLLTIVLPSSKGWWGHDVYLLYLTNMLQHRREELSSANNLVKLSNCFAISLMYIRNSSGLSTDPCGTPARINFIEKANEFSVCFRRLLLKKLLIPWSYFHLMPFCLNLNSRPRCHTLSKAFDISQKNYTGKSRVVENKMKPDWYLYIMLLSIKTRQFTEIATTSHMYIVWR